MSILFIHLTETRQFANIFTLYFHFSMCFIVMKCVCLLSLVACALGVTPPKAQATKRQNKQTLLHHNKELTCFKRHSEKVRRQNQRVGENICKLCLIKVWYLGQRQMNENNIDIDFSSASLNASTIILIKNMLEEFP